MLGRKIHRQGEKQRKVCDCYEWAGWEKTIRPWSTGRLQGTIHCWERVSVSQGPLVCCNEFFCKKARACWGAVIHYDTVFERLCRVGIQAAQRAG